MGTFRHKIIVAFACLLYVGMSGWRGRCENLKSGIGLPPDKDLMSYQNHKGSLLYLLVSSGRRMIRQGWGDGSVLKRI